jgi:hypothetical protein
MAQKILAASISALLALACKAPPYIEQACRSSEHGRLNPGDVYFDDHRGITPLKENLLFFDRDKKTAVGVPEPNNDLKGLCAVTFREQPLAVVMYHHAGNSGYVQAVTLQGQVGKPVSINDWHHHIGVLADRVVVGSGLSSQQIKLEDLVP